MPITISGSIPCYDRSLFLLLLKAYSDSSLIIYIMGVYIYEDANVSF